MEYKTMHLKELKKKTSAELVEMAEETRSKAPARCAART